MFLNGENGEFVETQDATQPIETLQYVDQRKPREMREDCRRCHVMGFIQMRTREVVRQERSRTRACVVICTRAHERVCMRVCKHAKCETISIINKPNIYRLCLFTISYCFIIMTIAYDLISMYFFSQKFRALAYTKKECTKMVMSIISGFRSNILDMGGLSVFCFVFCIR